MNATDFTYLLNKPNTLQERHAVALEKIATEFPYFQSAKALYLKGLFNQDSFKYNQTLKITAAHTTDRNVLFDFITSGQFIGLQQAFLDEKEARINAIFVHESEVITEENSIVPTNTLEQSILTSIKEATPLKEISETNIASQNIEEKLAIGKPLMFLKNETHSFQEWLQLANFGPIARTINAIEPALDSEKKKKLDLIDKFIESNPKIISIKNSPQTPPIIEQKPEDTSYLMTETLAKVYLEQKKYQKAIQAYEILILKYPEKSSLFADRISDIKILQQNNN